MRSKSPIFSLVRSVAPTTISIVVGSTSNVIDTTFRAEFSIPPSTVSMSCLGHSDMTDDNSKVLISNVLSIFNPSLFIYY